ncbi:MAG: hypothetical protein NT170_04485 [Candidatus Moranbacteria bacterium]|nr:hypothetical protein [Candidatus Moranbacteria bacterium]
MKKILIFSFCLTLALILSPKAKADTWTKQYLVDEATAQRNYLYKGTQDTSGNKWFIACSNTSSVTDDSVYEYTAGGTWVNHTDTIDNLIVQVTGDSNADKKKTLIYGDKSGNTWLMSETGLLFMYNGSSWSNVSVSSVTQQISGQNSGASFSGIFGDNQGNFYAIIGDYGTAKRSSSGTWTLAVPDSSVFDLETRRLSTGSYGRLYGAYNNSSGDFWFYVEYKETTGAYRYHGGDWTHFTTDNGLAGNLVNDIIDDSSGNIWVSTNNGASKFNGSDWTTWNSTNSDLGNDSVKQMSQDNLGRIWFVANGENGGTSIYDSSSNSWSYYSVKNGMDELENIGRVFFFGNDVWVTLPSGDQGIFIILQNNDTQATLYGQAEGTIVTKTSFDMLKKKAKVKTRKVTVSRRTLVKKKWKWQKAYSGKTSSGWYKALNLSVGTYKVQIQGLKVKTVNIANGDPYRLNF